MNTPPLSPVPASRNRWDLCDVSVDLDSLQATGVWGGVGERYSLKEGPTELSKGSLWGPELAQPGKEPQVSAPCRRPPALQQDQLPREGVLPGGEGQENV